MTQQPDLIAGGGIAGLAMALALGRSEALILEKSAHFGEAGAGLQLGPNAVRALQKLGAWDAVSPITSSPPEIHIWDGVTGKRLKRLALGQDFERRFGSPYRVAHRADLHRALLGLVRSRSNLIAQLGSAISEVGPDPVGVKVLAGNNVHRGQRLWGADGVHSMIRQRLVPGSAPVDSGARFHRALLSQNPAATDVDYSCVNLWMFPAGHVVHYPVGAAQRLNVVAIVPNDVEPRMHFRSACPSLQQIVESLQDASIWPGLYVKPLPTWQFGKITLLGDAAHGTLPYLAQGAAMALEDAAALMGGFAASDPATILNSRRQRTALLHHKTLAVGRTYHLGGVMRIMRNCSITVGPGSLMQKQLAWIYQHAGEN